MQNSRYMKYAYRPIYSHRQFTPSTKSIIVVDNSREIISNGKKIINFCYNPTLEEIKTEINKDCYKKKHQFYAFEKIFPNECPSDIIKRGQRLITEYEEIDYNLFYNGKLLNDENLSSSHLLEHIFPSVYLVKKEILMGGISGGGIISGGIFNFANVSKENTTFLTFNENAPAYRNATEGLNLFGRCSNEECESNGEEVIVPKGFNKEFDLGNEINTGKNRCPSCNQIVLITTCGFVDCFYNFEGAMIEGEKVKNFKSKTKHAPKDKMVYFIPEDELGVWIKLKIAVLRSQNKPYAETTIFR